MVTEDLFFFYCLSEAILSPDQPFPFITYQSADRNSCADLFSSPSWWSNPSACQSLCIVVSVLPRRFSTRRYRTLHYLMLLRRPHLLLFIHLNPSVRHLPMFLRTRLQVMKMLWRTILDLSTGPDGNIPSHNNNRSYRETVLWARRLHRGYFLKVDDDIVRIADGPFSAVSSSWCFVVSMRERWQIRLINCLWRFLVFWNIHNLTVTRTLEKADQLVLRLLTHMGRGGTMAVQTHLLIFSDRRIFGFWGYLQLGFHDRSKAEFNLLTLISVFALGLIRSMVQDAMHWTWEIEARGGGEIMPWDTICNSYL